jgi:hypothetical protein
VARASAVDPAAAGAVPRWWQHRARERRPFLSTTYFACEAGMAISQAITAATKLALPVAEAKIVQRHALLVAGLHSIGA